MKALLRKDFYVSSKQGGMLVGLALLFCLLPREKLGVMEGLGNTYAMMMTFFLPISTLSYDEKCKWDRYAAMLPYRPEQIVGSKYLLSGIFALIAGAVVLLGEAAQSLYSGTALGLSEARSMLTILAVALQILAVGMPVLYRFGAEKGQLVMLLAIAALGGALISLIRVTYFLDWAQWPLFLLLTVVMVPVSFRLSLGFYLKRRDGVYG